MWQSQNPIRTLLNTHIITEKAFLQPGYFKTERLNLKKRVHMCSFLCVLVRTRLCGHVGHIHSSVCVCVCVSE